VAAALGLMAILGAGSAARAQDETCWDDWGEAAEVVRRERLATVAEVAELARAHSPGRLLRTRLCEAAGVYTYHLVVRGPHGVLRPITVDARHPFHELPEKDK
jgi:uncharacterized membrane protein YkoI